MGRNDAPLVPGTRAAVAPTTSLLARYHLLSRHYQLGDNLRVANSPALSSDLKVLLGAGCFGADPSQAAE